MKNIPLYDVRPITTFKELLDNSCNIYTDKIAFYSPYQSSELVPITFNQLKADVYSFGTALLSLGLQRDNIAVIGENRYEWGVTYLATTIGGNIIVPIDKQLSLEEILTSFKRIDIKAVVFSDKLKETMLTIAKEIKFDYLISMDSNDEPKNNIISFQTLIQKGKDLLNKGDGRFANVTVNPDALSVLLFTSGTSAESKIVMLSQRNICFNIENQCKLVCVDTRDTFLSILPLHHTYECTCGFLTLIHKGCAVVYLDNLKHLQKYMQDKKVTVMLAVPAILDFMYKRIWAGIEKQGKGDTVRSMIKLTNFLDRIGIHLKRKIFKEILDQFGGELRLLIVGAAAINPETAKGFRNFGITAIQGYGLTECAPILALNRDIYYKDDAAGLPLINTEAKISEPNEEGIGEIITKGPHVMLGYYNNEEATNNSIRNGWLYTGDLGYFDKDGFIHITGRKKNVIVLDNGKNIYPEEIESLLNNSEYIKDCMVYGKKMDDDILLSVQVVVNTEAVETNCPDKLKNPDEIKNLIWEEVKKVNNTLVIYKHIKNVEIRDKEFQKTTTMKIKRYKEL